MKNHDLTLFCLKVI